ncbi:c-type cytochrome [Halomonas sp. V046]|uniref:c-type cytochrome n=1 Tax=Halomonas sp. V046 TaxID=3459611 RepID=UPI00404412D8
MTVIRRISRVPNLLVLALAGASFFTWTTASADDIEDAIEYRQDALGVMAWQIGPLGQMAQGKREFDAEIFAQRAANLAAVAPLPWEGFVEGSLQNDDHGAETDALPAIADDRADFDERNQALVKETATLAELARGEDRDAMFEQVAKVGNTCKGCHDNFRAE